MTTKIIGQSVINGVTTDISDAVTTLTGNTGSDSFTFTKKASKVITIDGGTSSITDGTVVPGSDPTKGSTLTSTVTYAQSDSLIINKSMDISTLAFTHIEKILLKDGVSLTMSSDQFENDGGSLDYILGTTTYNPGLHIEGVAGGKHEKLKIVVDKGADFQLDDANTGYLFSDVDVTVQFSGGDVRYDGTAAGEVIRGGSGTEYITARLGNDTVYAGAGNDLLVGHEGADKLYGEAGDDIFLITRIATKAGGGTFTLGKASDGTAELVAGDLMDGGAGVDELRITATGTGVGAKENTIVLNQSNFKNIEKVTIGTSAAIAKDASGNALFASTQDQMAAGKYTEVTTGTDKINVDGSALKVVVTFTGNNGDNILKGGSGNDVFHSNGGNDTLTGGKGNDKFVLDSALNATTNVDTITDFVAGKDKLVLDHTIFTGLTVGKLDVNAFNTGAAATETDDRITFDVASGKVYYDADGSGGAAPTVFVELTGVSSLHATDFLII